MASQKIKLSLSLAVADGRIPLSNPEAANSMKLVATVKQDSSPFPERPITILTMYSILDNENPDAFRRRMLQQPTDVDDSTKVIEMRPRFSWITLRPAGGNRNMRERSDHRFITIPPPGQGSAEVVFELAPQNLLRFYSEDGDLTERLKMFKAGQKFKIEPLDTTIFWWTFGSFNSTLKDKMLSRWSLPGQLPITRNPGEDETDEVNHHLEDNVDGKDLASIIDQWNLPGTPDPDDEKPPDVKQMRADGWVFGEPMKGLDMVCEDYSAAIFEFTE